jgi:hypothetical protein
MLAKPITYTDYDGVERTETFYFNISKAEIAEMELRYPGGYSTYLKKIIDAKEQLELVDAFMVFIMNSYGEKSEDGKYFTKSEEASKRFKSSPAYDELLFELLSDSDAASNFINAIMPEIDLGEDQKKELLDKTRARIEDKRVAG